MKPSERQTAILEYLRKYGKAQVDTLSEYFMTTGTTIRKDLVNLEKQQLVIRTYGGVMLNSEDTEHSIDHKTHINTNKKHQIAKIAASLITEGDSLIMDAGSTVLQMVNFLSEFNSLTIMTNSLNIMNELAGLHQQHTLLMPGGTFRKKSASFQGGLAESTFEKFTFDKLFIGADGVDLNVGITTFNEVHNVSKAMCKAAGKIILMVDSSKFGRKSPNVVCQWENIDTIITDTDIATDVYQALQDKGLTVLLANDTER